MVMLTPTLRALNSLDADCHITVMGKALSLQVIAGWEMVDAVITEPVDRSFDICFLSIHSEVYNRSYGEWLDSACADIRTIAQPLIWNIHEAEAQLEIARQMGYAGGLPATHCEYKASEPPDRVLIGIADTAAANWESKRWPHYPELINILGRNPLDIRIFGTEYDKSFWGAPAGEDYRGRTKTIPELAGLIKQCRLLICNDSGLAHISAALNVPTLAIFGPTLVVKNKPLGKHVKVIRRHLPCVPCQYTRHWVRCASRACLEGITAKDVWRRVQGLMEGSINADADNGCEL